MYCSDNKKEKIPVSFIVKRTLLKNTKREVHSEFPLRLFEFISEFTLKLNSN